MRKTYLPVFIALIAAMLMTIALPAFAFDSSVAQAGTTATVPAPTPTGTAASVVRCPGAPVARLKVGDTARVAQSYSTLWASIYSNVVLKVMYRAKNDTFEVLGGPFCGVGPYNWYQVRHAGVVGFVTEGTGSSYWIEPATPVIATPTVTAGVTPTVIATSTGACAGAPTPRLTVGGKGRVAQVYSSLRAGIGSSRVLAVMYRAKNDTFDVVAGPFCGYGPYNWYQVRFGTLTGYATEGTGSTYWLAPN